MENIKSLYLKRIEKYSNLLKKQKKIINLISICRLITFLGACMFSMFIYSKSKNYYFTIISFLLWGVLFIVLATIHEKLNHNKNLVENIIEINHMGINRAEGKWKDFEDDGKEYVKEDHPFSGDLDIFGRGSLFQYINCTTTFMGRNKLKDTLENPKYNIGDILNRQEAIEELGNNIKWRQRFQGEGFIKENKDKEKRKIEGICEWCDERHDLYKKTIIKSLINLFSLCIVSFIVLAFLFYGVYKYLALFSIAISIIVLFYDNSNRNLLLNNVFIYKKYIQSYYKMINLIEKEKFNSFYMIQLKEKIIKSKEESASIAIKELIDITNSISDRANFFYMIFNILFLLDYRHMMNLEKWKDKWGVYLKDWLEVIGEFEALSAISILRFENPSWTMPEFEKESLYIKGKELGHPLLGEKAVKNNITIGEGHKILLITGSNMSGKSTFLRTIGINLLLSYIGAPVYSKEFKCSLMDIYTCMRISDNLEKNISSFYGELLRIRKLIEGINGGRPVFFLLDEIFKGTNSFDRHTGAKILINKLSKENSIGLVSTHDLELSNLESENYNVKNYHFEEHYKDNNIYFDYKIKKGVSTTRNALYLMRIAGIDVKEE